MSIRRGSLGSEADHHTFTKLMLEYSRRALIVSGVRARHLSRVRERREVREGKKGEMRPSFRSLARMINFLAGEDELDCYWLCRGRHKGKGKGHIDKRRR